MKKFLFVMIACFGVIGGAVGGSTDDIRNACYPVALDDCGGRGAIQSLVAMHVAGAGALAGGAVGGFIGLAGGGYGGYLAGKNLGGKLAKAYSANEYIYFDDGTCLECDKHQWGENYECPNGTIVTNGTNFFKCHVEASGDLWREFKILPCDNSPIKDISVKNSIYEIKAAVGKPVKTGVSVYSGDACLYITCGDGVYNKTQNKCIPKDAMCKNGSSASITDASKCGTNETFTCTQKSTQGKCVCGACEKKQEQKKSCRESRAGNAEGMACCDLPKETAKWEGGKCICSGGLKFEIKEGKGMCVQEVKPGEKFECNAVILSALNTWLKDCVENTQIVTLITDIQALCKSEDRTVEKFNTLYQTLLALNPGDCKKEEVTQTNITIDVDVQNENRLARENIIAAHGQLEKIASGFGEASKWKTAEGNFNTARLMTDLSAGVVLGTVGGVVTSVLVKKKQVEEGFEDLKCTIGGQVVGNWGDEFRVGMQQ